MSNYPKTLNQRIQCQYCTKTCKSNLDMKIQVARMHSENVDLATSDCGGECKSDAKDM